MVFVVIHVLATALLVVPTFLVLYGTLAIGARAGWWIGDPTANDGEEYYSLPLGLLGWGLVLAVTAGLVTWLFRPRKSGRFILAGWLLLVLGQLFVWSVRFATG